MLRRILSCAKTQSVARTVGRLLLWLCKWIFVLWIFLFTIAPTLWMVLSSFKTNFEIFAAPLGLPDTFNLANYIKALHIDGLFIAIANTVFVSATSTAICVLVATMASYGFLYRYKLNSTVFSFIVVGIFVPVNAFMVPYMFLANTLQIYNTVWVLIAVYSATGVPLAVLIITNYLKSLPFEIFEAASMDGCGFSNLFLRVALPLSVPGMATISIFQFVNSWNEFLFASLLTQDKYSRTLQVTIRFVMSTYQTDYATLFAAMTICLLPTIIAYVLFQEQIISGMTSGAVKA